MSNENERTTSPEKLIGEKIDNYKVIQRIGESMVFLAYKDDFENQVAIKIFYPDPYACNRQEILDRLYKVSQLEHENIVKVYKVGEYKDFIYAIMEYVPGENLYDLMQRNPRLHWAAAAEIAREIVKGLVAAHEKNVTHRSLHPDRILLGKGGQIKINFCNEGEITPSSELVHYVPPELFLGQELDERSDIYSLGTIIYNIVTGKPPLAGKSPKEIALKHREMLPVIPSYGVADIPHSLSLILSRALSKELKHRYQHSFELQAAIKNFLLNDIKNYKLGSYKELLPKVVEVSKCGKAFTQAISMEKKKIKERKKEGTETAELMEEIKITVTTKIRLKEKEKFYLRERNLFHLSVILGCIFSVIINIGLLFLIYFLFKK